MIEVWRPYDEVYWVSNFGRVYANPRAVRTKDQLGKWSKRVIKGKLLRGYKTPSGYQIVGLRGGKNIFVHRMVAKAFCPNPNNKPHVNHIDGNPSNNVARNLEWCTHAENMTHARATGLIDQNIAVRCIDTGEVFKSLHEAARSRGRAVGNLCSTLKGQQKTWDGHRWEYAEDVMAGAQVA